MKRKLLAITAIASIFNMPTYAAEKEAADPKFIGIKSFLENKNDLEGEESVTDILAALLMSEDIEEEEAQNVAKALVQMYEKIGERGLEELQIAYEKDGEKAIEEFLQRYELENQILNISSLASVLKLSNIGSISISRAEAVSAGEEDGNKLGIWTKGFGSDSKFEKSHKVRAYGFVGGIDTKINDDLVLGVMGGYSEQKVKLSTPKDDNIKVDTANFGVYGAYMFNDALSLNSSLALGFSKINGKSKKAAYTFATKAKSFAFKNLLVCKLYNQEGAYVNGLFGIEYDHININETTIKHSNGTTTKQPKVESDIVNVLAGAKIGKDIAISDMVTFSPSLSLVGKAEVYSKIGKDKLKINAHNLKNTKHSAEVSFGAKLVHKDQMELEATAGAEFGKKMQATNVGLKLKVNL